MKALNFMALLLATVALIVSFLGYAKAQEAEDFYTQAIEQFNEMAEQANLVMEDYNEATEAYNQIAGQYEEIIADYWEWRESRKCL